MTDKEALAAIEKEMGCMSEDPGRCCRTTCPSCRHFVDPEKFFDALAVAAKALREKVEAEAEGEPALYAERVRIFDNPRTGRLFTACSWCQGKVGAHDKYCKHCGREFWDTSCPSVKEVDGHDD